MLHIIVKAVKRVIWRQMPIEIDGGADYERKVTETVGIDRKAMEA